MSKRQSRRTGTEIDPMTEERRRRRWVWRAQLVILGAALAVTFATLPERSWTPIDGLLLLLAWVLPAVAGAAHYRRSARRGTEPASTPRHHLSLITDIALDVGKDPAA